MNLPERIPRATYRVQMHAGFNFQQLAEIIPYLHELGISDLYLSPCFTATAGSMHGYDVCDHNQINPELGGMPGLLTVSRLLRERDMGLLIDFIPNHMGIEGPLNWRWMDLLEFGRMSRFAAFFDVELNPRQVSLQDRIIIPLLGDFYGRVLDRGEISVKYSDGIFQVCYGSLRFPLRPESAGELVGRLADSMATSSDGGPPHKLREVAAQFSSLTGSETGDAGQDAQKREWHRDRLRRELSALIRESFAADLERLLEQLNGVPNEAESFDQLHRLLEQQHYRLAYWKTGTNEINYRRFFAVDTLVGLRMEMPEVFSQCHQLLRTLLDDGVITGVRIDHIDGLWNPAEYLERLNSLAGNKNKPFYGLVEKILTENEDLPESWATHGTTGYDFAGSLIDLLLDSQSETEFTRIYDEFTGKTVRVKELAYRLKLHIMESLFPNAVDNFALELESQIKSDRRWRDWTVNDLRPALARIIACLPVYRTYRTPGRPPSSGDIQVVEGAVNDALRLNHASSPEPYHFIRDIWCGRYPDKIAGPEMQGWADGWVCKLQQYTGAIMAKSVEDTLFYQHVRLFAANEVGHDPGEFGRPLSVFHEGNIKRLRHWPASMLATSTHDTKMSEDVRARLLALSEIPQEWEAALHRWSKLNHTAKTLVGDSLAPDANEEYLLYQILLGAWPTDPKEADEAFRERIVQYMHKALAEAKAHTNWATPDEAWMEACDDFIGKLLDQEGANVFRNDFLAFAERLALQGMKMSLVQTAVKLTAPGVPDIYQGTELWNLSLVDPDNRRPVDYEIRQRHLATLDNTSIPELMASWKDGRIKMRLIRTLLQHRSSNPDLYARGSYTPVNVNGARSDRFVSFLREWEGTTLLVVALRRFTGDNVTELKEIFNDMMLSNEALKGDWRSILTAQTVECESGEIALGVLFDSLPVAIFVRGSVRLNHSQERGS